MYVLADLEWLINNAGRTSPTQLAACRMDENYVKQSYFQKLCRPQTAYDYIRDHPSYSGYCYNDFMNAPSAYSVLTAFYNWLKPDDILLWWTREEAHIFERLTQLILQKMPDRKSFHLQDAFLSCVRDGKPVSGPVYLLLRHRGFSFDFPEHKAVNDVRMLHSLLKAVRFPLNCHDIYLPAGKEDASMTTATELPLNAQRYIVLHKSDRFHRPDCSVIRRSKTRFGTAMYYEYCIQAGLKPCAVCHPAPSQKLPARSFVANPFASGGAQHHTRPDLPHFTREQEVRTALTQHEHLLRERLGMNLSEMNEQERKDALTLTNPGFAFWSATGYQNFHVRNCPKLRSLSNLTGYAKYSDAATNGRTPCRYCNPSPKADIHLHIPADSKKREDETVESILERARAYGYQPTLAKTTLTIDTPVGFWSMDTKERPVVLLHLNKMISLPGSALHRQPKCFLSLTDALRYIHAHDSKLKKNGPFFPGRTEYQQNNAVN